MRRLFRSRGVDRRSFIGGLMSLPMLALFRARRTPEDDSIVEVGGWILKRSDIA